MSLGQPWSLPGSAVSGTRGVWQRGRVGIGDLAFAGQALHLLRRDEADSQQFRGLGVSLAQVDACGEIDISGLVGGAVAGVELADVAEIGRAATDLFV
jgi:hypothetical protein